MRIYKEDEGLNKLYSLLYDYEGFTQ